MSSTLIHPAPDDSRETFETIKGAANKNWQRIKIEEGAYGFQIQRGTKWRDGLNENALAEFEKEMGYEFPLPLKNYFLTMNGLDTPGINIYGSSGYPESFKPVFYSYPEDLGYIKETVAWVLDANNISPEDLPAKASRIFPVMGHRFLLIDDPQLRVLSMYGNDIIYWSDSLSKFLVKEIFPRKYYVAGFDNPDNIQGIRLWMDG